MKIQETDEIDLLVLSVDQNKVSGISENEIVVVVNNVY